MKTRKTLCRIAFLAIVFLLVCAFALAESFKATVTVDKMTVRSGPSSKDKLLGYLTKGAQVTVHSYKNGVAYIEYNGKYGWALVSNMKRVSSSSTPKPTQQASLSGLGTVTANGGIKVYASASTSSKVLCTLAKGRTITVLATKGDWARLQNGTAIGYAQLSGLKIDTSAAATPAPSAAPSPTPTANVSGAEEFTQKYTWPNDKVSETAVVRAEKMTVRKGPSANAARLGTLAKDTKITLHTLKDEYAFIEYKGQFGFCLASDIKITQANSELSSGVGKVTASSLKVYSSASTSASVSGTIGKGESYQVLSVRGDWAKLKNGSHVGYVPLSGLKIAYGASLPAAAATPSPTPTAAPTAARQQATVNVSSMKVYASASTSAKVLGKYARGRSFELIAVNGEWAKLKNGNAVGYAKVADLKLPEGVATPAPSPVISQTMSEEAFFCKDNTPIYRYATKDSAVIGTAKLGLEVKVLGVSGDWAYIYRAGNYGYTAKSALIRRSSVRLPVTVDEEAEVVASSAKVYRYATDQSVLLGTISKGTGVTVVGYNDTWAYIRRNDNEGYVLRSALKLSGKPTINGNLNIKSVMNASSDVYRFASTSSEKQHSLAKGTTVTVSAMNDEWCYVNWDGKGGYVPLSRVTLLSTHTLAPNVKYAVKVKTESPVYEYAIDKSQKLGTLAAGTELTLLAYDGSWALVERSGKRGYMPLSALQKDEFTNPTVKNLSATVIADKVKMYEMAVETASVIRTLPITCDVTVTAFTSKWARVKFDGKEGYVLMANLSADSYSELKSGKGSKDEIIKLQKALEDLGYFDGSPAGNYGPLTTAAVQRFQTQMGLTADGVASVSLIRTIYGGHAPVSSIRSRTLNVNDTGSDVLRLQNRLTTKGYMSATIDGEYGPVTKNAVKLYQKTAGLSETGIADSATLSSLFSLSAPKNPGAAVTGGSNNNTTPSTGGSMTGSTNALDDPLPGTASDKIETVIDWALQQLGKPYIYGTTGPNSYDCSGLTYYCFKKVGKTTGRSAYSCGYNSGTRIDGISNLKRGDIVCFNTLDDNDLSDHVGIYLGNLKFVHASSAAGKVIISSLDSKSYYYRVFSWGRRIL